MKALDLQIFEKHPDVDAYRFGPSFTPYAIVAQEKRFTGAELAAEYHRAGDDMAETNYDRESKPDMEPIRRILHRFATLPHYDEQ